MDNPLVLTDGSVTFRPVYTHGMECAFKEALLKGMQLKQSGGEVIVEDIQADALDRATEAVLQLAIETITRGADTVPYSREWLMGLPERDFLLLKERVEDLRAESESRKAAGKKNG